MMSSLAPDETLFSMPLMNQDRRNTFAERSAFENGVAAFFQKHCAHLAPFPHYYQLRAAEFKILRGLLTHWLERIDPQSTLLEIGCGFGYRTAFWTSFVQRVVGIDIPENYGAFAGVGKRTTVDQARSLFAVPIQKGRMQFLEAWPYEIALPDHSVQTLYSEYVLEHIPDLSKAAREWRRLLHPQGIMIHVVPVTNDASLEFVRANIRPPLKAIVKGWVARLLRARADLPRFSLNRSVIPGVHSEFARDFGHQIEIYTLENYLFPFLDEGFVPVEILQTRETNRVIIFRHQQNL